MVDDNAWEFDQPRVIKAHCPECGADRKAFVRGEHRVDSHDQSSGTSSRDTGMILECCGCERVYFRRDFWFSEWESFGEDALTGEPTLEGGTETTYWPPASSRKRPHWLTTIHEADPVLGGLLTEMYDAIAGDLRVLAAIAVRTAFDRASEKFGVETTKSFKEKLDYLSSYGHIGYDEEDVLSVLVDAGNAAAHRAWRPSIEELSTMVDMLESFIHRSFVIGGGIKKLKASVPPKPQRSK
jgi:hypothetical protein